jgi:hypothetical protein
VRYLALSTLFFLSLSDLVCTNDALDREWSRSKGFRRSRNQNIFYVYICTIAVRQASSKLSSKLQLHVVCLDDRCAHGLPISASNLRCCVSYVGWPQARALLLVVRVTFDHVGWVSAGAVERWVCLDDQLLGNSGRQHSRRFTAIFSVSERVWWLHSQVALLEQA